MVLLIISFDRAATFSMLFPMEPSFATDHELQDVMAVLSRTNLSSIGLNSELRKADFERRTTEDY